MIPELFAPIILEVPVTLLSIVEHWNKIQNMIDVGDIVLRWKDEQGSNVSKNPFHDHKGTVGAITLDEEFEESTQYIVDEAEIVGIIEKPFVLEEKSPEIRDIRKPFMIDLPSFKPIILEFSEQSLVHNLQEVP